MTAQNPAIFFQSGSHPAEDVRRMFSAIAGGTPAGSNGIFEEGDLAVSEKSGTPDMSVDVAEGAAWVAGSEGTYQGSYFVENRGVTNLAISTADPTNPRNDLIVAKVEDSAYSGATDAWSLAVVTGIPAASPSDPSAPDNSIILAVVQVPAAATSIVNANITDRRVSTQKGRVPAGIVVTTSGSSPASPTEGMVIYETDTNQLKVYNGSAWVAIADLDVMSFDASGNVTVALPTGGTFEVEGSGAWLFKSGKGGNSGFQLSADISTAGDASLVNNWANSSNPGVTIGTSRTDGAAFHASVGIGIDADGYANDAGTPVLSVFGNGRIGMIDDAGGTTGPLTSVAITDNKNDAAGNVFEVRNTATGDGTVVMNVRHGSETPSSTGGWIRFNDASDNQHGLLVGFGGGIDLFSASDRRLKTDIRDADKGEGLRIIEAVRIRDYLWDEDGDGLKDEPGKGPIAQELAEVLPRATAGDPDGYEPCGRCAACHDASEDPERPLSVEECETPRIHPMTVSKAEIIPDLVLAVQALAEQVRDLKAQLEQR